ncbi:MAG: hypothetical protein PHH11_02570 [Methylomonas sp.]|nr:hypothetical protein [Methylomonas sp.]
MFIDSGGEPERMAFWDDEPSLFAESSPPAEWILNALSSKVRKKPRDLMSHLCRIYFCYRNKSTEPLFAALLDLLIVLNGKGRALSARMIQGSRAELDFAQISELKRSIDYPHNVRGNRYSLFTSGRVGTAKLVEIAKTDKPQHDYLLLANDFIEFSQLEEAMSMLELGLEHFPERQDLQSALLELYKSTNSRERFNEKYEAIKAAGVTLIDEWRALADFFDGKTL